MDDLAGMSIEELASRYFATLTALKRQKGEAAVTRFVRWCGRERAISRIKGRDIEQYALGLGISSVASQSPQHVRPFLTYLHKQGATRANLATSFRIRKISSAPESSRRRRALTQLTKEGYQRLKVEMEKLKSQRGEIAEELRRAAADKDFRENAPLEAARDHQGMVEARIRELEAVLNSSVLLEAQGAGAVNSKVVLGNSVTLVDLSSGEDLRYTLVNPDEAKLAEGKISVASPVGKALLGKAKGEKVQVTVPAGILHFRIKGIAT